MNFRDASSAYSVEDGGTLMVLGWIVAEVVGGGLQATHNSKQSPQRGLNIVPDLA